MAQCHQKLCQDTARHNGDWRCPAPYCGVQNTRFRAVLSVGAGALVQVMAHCSRSERSVNNRRTAFP